MTGQHHLVPPGASYLAVGSPGRPVRRLIDAEIVDGAGRRTPVLLPHFGLTTYRIEASAPVHLALREAADVHPAPSPPPMTRETARMARRARIAVGDTVIGPVAYCAGAMDTATVAFMREVRGLNFMGLYPVAHRPSAHAALPSPARGVGQRVGTVVHLHYPELWPELAAALRCLPPEATIMVTLTPAAASAERAVLSAFPGAEVSVVENRGYDIAPFVQALTDGALDRFDVVCKVHGKKSVYPDGTPSLAGALWRDAALGALLGSGQGTHDILERFAADDRLGIVGPRPLHARFDGWRRFVRMKSNRRALLHLAARMGVPWYRVPLDFFAGSMFWARPAALRPLAALRLQIADFPPVAGERDGTLAHAVERVFNIAVMRAGYRVAAVPKPAPQIMAQAA